MFRVSYSLLLWSSSRIIARGFLRPPEQGILWPILLAIVVDVQRFNDPVHGGDLWGACARQALGVVEWPNLKVERSRILGLKEYEAPAPAGSDVASCFLPLGVRSCAECVCARSFPLGAFG